MTQTKLYPNPIVPLTESYQADLIKSLQNPTEAATYLEAALEVTDMDMLHPMTTITKEYDRIEHLIVMLKAVLLPYLTTS